ncbi:MAG: FliM/FliN family flagellar motor switch protein, partial [Candidatus Eremiobacteraeota bacterium]|nr:FliM/FliN family flagellar motor switch protein [Candidatus Eremiobacteraeota bacterium]
WVPQKLRDLTDIERTLMQRFMARMLNSYREAWNYLLTLSLKIEALDSNPQFIPRIIPLDQVVCLIRCDLKVGEMTGLMNFALPYLVLQSIGPQLADFQWSPSVVAGRGMTEEDIAQLARNVERAEVNVKVELGHTIVSLRDLLSLAPGDVVLFDKLTTQPLVAKINDIDKFEVFAGTNRDRLAVQVSEVLESEDE